MGYHVKIEELLEVQSQMLNQLSEWGVQLETVYQALEMIVVTPCIQGETGKSIQNYIQEVHIPVIGSLQQLLTEFQVRLSVYAEGYYGIDSSYEAEIPQEILEEQQKALENGREDFENLREEINSIISSVSDIVSVAQPLGLSLVLSYQLMESRVKTLNSDIGDYEQTHQNDTQNMDSMMETIRSILIARTGSPAVSVTNYQAGSIAKLPAYQSLQIGCESSESYVAQNIAQYEAARKKFEDKINDKLADERIEKGFWTLFGGTMSVIAGAALIIATAGMATPIVVGAFTVGSISMLYGLSNSEEGANSISLGLKGDGSTVALNPIRDTLFTNNPELYYTIGNTSTLVSALAIPIGGAGNAALIGGTSPIRAMAVEGGKILVSSVSGDLTSRYIYSKTGNISLSVLSGIGMGGITYGGLTKIDSVANVSGLNANSNIADISKRENITNKVGVKKTRPTWRQSELDAAKDFPDYQAQKSFINGKEVPYGTKGSVRPDYYKSGNSVDVKNYNVESASGRSNLARNIEKQYHQRMENLPEGTKQSVLIDIRGQNVTDAELSALYNDIMKRTGSGIEILFKMN